VVDSTEELIQRQWMSGHRSGYLDAIAEVWEMSHEAFEARDEERMRFLNEVARELRERMERVTEAERSRVLATAD